MTFRLSDRRPVWYVIGAIVLLLSFSTSAAGKLALVRENNAPRRIKFWLQNSGLFMAGSSKLFEVV